jgi:hypothetical protein
VGNGAADAHLRAVWCGCYGKWETWGHAAWGTHMQLGARASDWGARLARLAGLRAAGWATKEGCTGPGWAALTRLLRTRALRHAGGVAVRDGPRACQKRGAGVGCAGQPRAQGGALV